MYKSQDARTPDELVALRRTTSMFVKLPEATWEQAVRGELWSTNFSDPGPDYNELRLFDKEGQQIANERINGY